MKRFALLIALAALVGTAAGALAARPPKTTLERRYVAFFSPATGWDYGRGFGDQPGAEGHRKYWEAHHQDGKVLLGGYFKDGKGAMIVGAEGIGRAELENLASKDPAVRGSVMEFEVREMIADFLPRPPPEAADDDLDEEL